MVKFTIKQLADQLGVDYNSARGLIAVATKQGQVIESHKMTPSSTKGRASTVYELPTHITISLPLQETEGNN